MRSVQEFQAATNSYGCVRRSNIHGAPVYWRDSNHNLQLHVWGEEDFLRSFQFNGRRFEPAAKSTMRAPENSMPGGILSLSANRSAAGSAVVWASIPIRDDAKPRTVPGILRAFDGANVQKELWNSEQNAGRDQLGWFAKFCPPVVANGKVYMATFAEPSSGKPGAPNKLVVYGALKSNGSTPTSTR